MDSLEWLYSVHVVHINGRVQSTTLLVLCIVEIRGFHLTYDKIRTAKSALFVKAFTSSVVKRVCIYIVRSWFVDTLGIATRLVVTVEILSEVVGRERTDCRCLLLCSGVRVFVYPARVFPGAFCSRRITAFEAWQQCR